MNSAYPSSNMTTFLLNPYEASLNLTNKDDRKLFQDGCKGLSDEEQIFDGKREKFSKVSKLLVKEFDDIRVMECLRIPTSWPATGSASGNTNSSDNRDDRYLQISQN